MTEIKIVCVDKKDNMSLSNVNFEDKHELAKKLINILPDQNLLDKKDSYLLQLEQVEEAMLYVGMCSCLCLCLLLLVIYLHVCIYTLYVK